MTTASSDRSVAALEQELARLEGERRELFARLAQLESERTDRAIELFTMAAHELNTPLQSLLLGTDSVLQRLSASADEVSRDWLIERITRQQHTMARLSELVRSLLNVAQLRAGAMVVTREEVDLAALTRELVARNADELQWAGCSVAIDVRHPAVGSWDRARIEGALSNLISNAIKFGAGNPIGITIDSDAQCAFVTVRDHGIGISLADQERIFDRFERGSAPVNVPGFGLGLWVARALLRDLGGAISVASEPGAGASFVIQLPRAHA